MTKKTYSDPRWREWPNKGIIFGKGKGNAKVHKATQEILKRLSEKEDNKHGKR